MLECLFSVRQLLNSGVSPDLVNEDGLTALHQVRTHTCTVKKSQHSRELVALKHGEPGGVDGDASRFSAHIVLSKLCFVSGFSPRTH